MAERDPEAIERLFETEPTRPPQHEAARWVQLYTELTEMLQRQLDETRRFAEGAPDQLQRYLDGENVKILGEELDAFKRRLAYWRQDRLSDSDSK